MKSVLSIKNIKSILAMTLMSSILTGCTIAGEPIGESIKNTVDTTTITNSEVVTLPIEKDNTNQTSEDEEIDYIGTRQVVDGKMQSYLTGEWKDVDIVTRRPMAVMIPNNSAALPQYGISLASVIYEAPMESYSCTRLMGIFEDYDELAHIGPLRSSRLYFLEEALTFDAIYCNWGLAVPYVGQLINTDRVDNISAAVSGIDNPSDEAFERDANRKAAGYATEYTGIMTIFGYNEAVKRQGYSTTRSEDFEETFVFATDGQLATYDDFPDYTTIYLYGGDPDNGDGGYGNTKPYFVYDPVTHLYTRYQNGEPQIDDYNDEPLTVTNIVLKFTDCSIIDPNGYLGMDTSGQDGLYVFTNGKLVYGYWTREEGDSSANHFYDTKGNEIIFNQGKTWVCLISNDHGTAVRVE